MNNFTHQQTQSLRKFDNSVVVDKKIKLIKIEKFKKRGLIFFEN
jgi:hypothetical protein